MYDNVFEIHETYISKGSIRTIKTECVIKLNKTISEPLKVKQRFEIWVNSFFIVLRNFSAHPRRLKYPPKFHRRRNPLGSSIRSIVKYFTVLWCDMLMLLIDVVIIIKNLVRVYRYVFKSSIIWRIQWLSKEPEKFNHALITDKTNTADFMIIIFFLHYFIEKSSAVKQIWYRFLNIPDIQAVFQMDLFSYLIQKIISMYWNFQVIHRYLSKNLKRSTTYFT